MKLNPSFIQFICLKIENQCQSSKGENPNKKDIFITIIKKLFPEITQSEIDTAVKIVDFLVKNVLIKKVPLSKIFKYYIKKKFAIQ
jgi:hypothetical protein